MTYSARQIREALVHGECIEACEKWLSQGAFAGSCEPLLFQKPEEMCLCVKAVADLYAPCWVAMPETAAA